MENINFYDKYIEIKDKYPILLDNIRIHQWPHTNVIAGQNRTESKLSLENNTLTTINNDGLSLFLLCNGTRSVDEIINELYKNLTEEIALDEFRTNIAKFLSIGNKLFKPVEFLEEKADVASEVLITGSKDATFPLHAVVELTSKCNLKCSHCFKNSSPTVIEDEIPFEKLKLIFDSLKKNGVYTIELTGGEVFLHPEAKEIIRYACENFISVAILTNGTIPKPDYIDTLDKFRDKLVWSISLDSYREEFHDKFRGLNGAHKKTVSLIKYLVSKGYNVRASMSVCQDNIDDIEKTAEFVRDELNTRWFGYNFILNVGRATELVWTHTPKQLMERQIELDEYTKDKREFMGVISPEQIEAIKLRTSNCGAGWKSIVVGSNGNIRPCVMMPEEIATLGNILDNSLEDIVTSPLNKLFSKLPWPTEEDCSGCPNINFCRLCSYRGFMMNKERLLQGLGLCKWAKKHKIQEYINLIEDEQVM